LASSLSHLTGDTGLEGDKPSRYIAIKGINWESVSTSDVPIHTGQARFGDENPIFRTKQTAGGTYVQYADTSRSGQDDRNFPRSIKTRVDRAKVNLISAFHHGLVDVPTQLVKNKNGDMLISDDLHSAFGKRELLSPGRAWQVVHTMFPIDDGSLTWVLDITHVSMEEWVTSAHQGNPSNTHLLSAAFAESLCDDRVVTQVKRGLKSMGFHDIKLEIQPLSEDMKGNFTSNINGGKAFGYEYNIAHDFNRWVPTMPTSHQAFPPNF
jgi:hypothetical protein